MPTRTLSVMTGPRAGTSVDVGGEIVVGREGADLSLPDEQISRRHAAVRSVDGGIEVEDLGSLNGTFVDGRRLEGPVTVASAGTLRVGTTEMSLQIELPAPEVTRAREIPAIEATRAREIPAVEVTRARQVPDANPVADLQGLDVTRARAVPVQQETRAREVPGAPEADHGAAAPSRSPLLFAALALVVAVVVAVLVLLVL
jgi:predicted component of type VI protein secretion system